MTVGRRLIDEWEEILTRFVKIFPTDYKSGLAERAGAERAGGEAAASNGAGRSGEPPRVDEFEGETVDVVGAPQVREGDGE